MSTELETNSHSRPQSARELRERNLQEKQAYEKYVLDRLESVGDFLKAAMVHFWPETSGKPVIDLTLSSPEWPSKITLRLGGDNRFIDATDDNVEERITT
jgi:hypothetical protein